MHAEKRVPLRVRLLAASISSCVTITLTNPLDVARVRLQTAIPSCGCAHINLELLKRCSVAHTRSVFGMLRCIAKREAVKALWAGSFTTLSISIPQACIFFPCYEELKRVFGPKFGLSASSLLASVLSRTLTTSLMSPLEFVRTNRLSRSVSISNYEFLRREVAVGGVSGIYKGLAPSLMRDIPFSALYWLGYEHARAMYRGLHHKHPLVGALISRAGITAERIENSNFLLPFLSGASSSMWAAFLTHPFDVVKTQRQVDMYAADVGGAVETRHMSAIFRELIKTQGIRGLYMGLAPRTIRLIPACAIMIGVFEMMKSRLSS